FSADRLAQTAAEAAAPQLSRTACGKGACMPRVVLTHAVEDVERWLEGKAERAAAIGAAGTNVTDYVALDGSNKIAVTTDVHDMDAAQAMITSPRRTPEREPPAQVVLELPARLA